MRRSPTFARTLPFVLLLVLAACADGAPVAPPGPEPVDTPVLAQLECTADVRGGTVQCVPAAPALPAGVRGNLVLGWQGVTVRLISNGASYDGTSTFRVDVTVQNLLGQPIGTVNEVTTEPEGIRVFFASGPTATVGAGEVEVANPDGTAMFMGANQPYHRYVALLGTEVQSEAKEWRFTHPNTVSRFRFTVYVSAPVPDEGALAAIDLDPRTLAVGGYHSCGIGTTGQAYCWGTNDDGQMGSTAADSVPVVVDGGHFWRTLSAGRYHTCGITTENAAYCWGDNQTGQLGNGNPSDAFAPVPVAGGYQWLMIDAGAGHTCGVTTTLDAYCWGDGTAGQAGGGDSAVVATPAPVLGGRKWATVDAGADHSCGVTRGGAAFCWGDDADGELGGGAGTPSARPVLVAGGHSWRHASAGEGFSCGITSRGVALCWGSDSSEQLGNGASGASATPSPVAGGLEWLRITAGRATACGVTTGSAGYCWGDNDAGEIGDGTRTDSDAPVAIGGGGGLWGPVSGGEYHTCGVTQSGEARCWGYNAQGQLGDGTRADRPAPAPVSGGVTWVQ